MTIYFQSDFGLGPVDYGPAGDIGVCEICEAEDMELVEGRCEECNNELVEAKEEHMQHLMETNPDVWWQMQPMREHVCDGCGITFREPAVRGNLGFCNRCADIIEAGGDIG